MNSRGVNRNCPRP
jgi:hypothetical protein